MAQQYQTKDKSVTLYLNGVAHVATSAQLNTSDSTVHISGIAPRFDLETLHPMWESKGVRVLEARVLEPTKLVEIAKSKIGQEVYDRQSDENVRVFGVEDGQLLVRGLKGVYTKPLTAFDYKIVEDIRERRVIELKLEGLGDDKQKTLDMSYLTEGITLTPHYNIVLAGGKLALTGEVKVDNRTGKFYEGVELEVIPGEVGAPYLPRGVPSRIRRVAAIEMLALAEEVETFEEAGQIHYYFGKRNLPKGESRFNAIPKKEGLDYQIIYKANLKSTDANISTNLKFKAPMTLPAGAVAVFGEKGFKEENLKLERYGYEGGGALKSVLAGKDAAVRLRTPDTLEMKVEQVGETKPVETELRTEDGKRIWAFEKEYKVTANNAGKDKVTIETYLKLGKTEKIIETSLPLHPDSSARKARWDIVIESSKETEPNKETFTYKIQDIRFKPMGEDEIRARLGRK